MNRIIILLMALLIFRVYSHNKIVSLQPQPESKYIKINSGLIIGFEKVINIPLNKLEESILIQGSKSGIHKYELQLSEGNKVLVRPVLPFQFNEVVNINFTKDLLNAISRKEYSYSFRTEIREVSFASVKDFISGQKITIDQLLLPPELNVTVNNNPSPGYFFITPFAGGSDIIIANNNGTPYWNRHFAFTTGDFKVQPNGLMTYFSGNENAHFGMNSSFEVTHQFYCGNGYTTDIHELKVLNNGHALLMAYDPQIIDMREILSGGDSDATVIGLIIQETDENNNVIFQWRSWDHFDITDATHENLLDSVIDYVHGNAIEVDTDNNLLISSRNMDEITKIHRITGNIIWRFGGENNQFSFVNDSIGFSHQHDIRRISNGNITLYDNGNFHTPSYSRAIEYSLNESTMTATLVWQYRNTPDVYASWGGNVQRLPDGNTVIFWGGAAKTVTEVKQNGTKTFEASYPFGIFTYRGYKFNWNPPVGISLNNEIPVSYRLYQNYPNPFNPSTHIEFDIPEYIRTQIVIFDICGREIVKLLDKELQPGRFSVVFDASSLSSGLYFCKMITPKYSEVKKMMLIK
jgi:hypothetical protein